MSLSCESYTLKGSKCIKKALPDNLYCHLHRHSPIIDIKKPEKETPCEIKTRNGRQCTNRAISGKNYCGIHRYMAQYEERKKDDDEYYKEPMNDKPDKQEQNESKTDPPPEENKEESSKDEQKKEEKPKSGVKERKNKKKEKQQCKGFTKNGRKCMNKGSCHDDTYCRLHENQYQPKTEEKKEKTPTDDKPKKEKPIEFEDEESEDDIESSDEEPEQELPPPPPPKAKPARKPRATKSQHRKKCTSFTKGGTPCCKFAMEELEYCSVHRNKHYEKPADYDEKKKEQDDYWKNYQKSYEQHKCSYMGGCNTIVGGHGQFCWMHLPKQSTYKCSHLFCFNNVSAPGLFCYLHIQKTYKCSNMYCVNNVNVAYQYCYLHTSKPTVIIFFNNTLLDNKLIWMDQTKKQKLADAIKNYDIDPKTINLNDVKKIYRKRSMIHHPDKGGDVEKFKKNLSDKELIEEFLT